MQKRDPRGCIPPKPTSLSKAPYLLAAFTDKGREVLNGAAGAWSVGTSGERDDPIIDVDADEA